MFDQAHILVKVGDGGDGAISFRREKFVPFGGPDGGDGGDGGDVIIIADHAVTDLRLFRRKRVFHAGNGGDGEGKKKHGKKGASLVLRVPVGTIVRDEAGKADDEVIADLEELGQQEVVARGGRGGWGNTHYVSSTNQVPRLAQKGEPGEERFLLLELRLIADVGIIGYPNAGKSTLLSIASAARPKIAEYPFTTLEPVLGVVEVGQKSMVVAEIPGLIEGAHLGRGLGHDFLRHAMRTRVLIHLIDGASASPWEDMAQVNSELSQFDLALAEKPQIVAVNKIDLPQVRACLAEIKEAFNQVGLPVLFISAATGEGVGELLAEAAKMLAQQAAEPEVRKGVPKVFRPQPRESGVSVRREEDAFVVAALELERIIARVDLASYEVRRQLRGQLDKLSISGALERAGVKPGDKVRCGDFEWEW